MSRNYNVLHYIKKQVDDFNGDERLYNVLSQCFNFVYKKRVPDGCLYNSVLIFVCLKEYGYNPQFCYGLCNTKEGSKFYHAWLELESKVIDVAIYGNLNYSPKFPSDMHIEFPIILENYNDCYIDYGKYVLDNEWKHAQISHAEKWSIFQYIDKSPQKFMYKHISKIMNLPLCEVEKIVSCYKNITFADFNNSIK